MSYITIEPGKNLHGELLVPGDKSISHRAVMLGSLAKGKTQITNFSGGYDCRSTIFCFQDMGVNIEYKGSEVIVEGVGLNGLCEPKKALYTGNSGTTTRLLSGILCGQKFTSVIGGDESIAKRPMKRIIDPLRQMGANITSKENNDCAPLFIKKSELHGISYKSAIASAQVKSCILLAGLYADSETSVTEPYLSRNHTELMLNYFGGNIKSQNTTATVQPNPSLEGRVIQVPSDISSAAYFIVAGLITPGSDILIKNVGINPTRAGIIEVCRKMGGNIELLDVDETRGEPLANIHVTHSALKGIDIGGDIIPSLIDEIPVIAVLACFAEGTTKITEAKELRVKESDRIQTMTRELSKMGADITPLEDGMIIKGTGELRGTMLESHNDHRVAMSLAVAALNANKESSIENFDCTSISYPEFIEDLNKLR